MTLKFLRLKLLGILIMVAFIVCSSCTRKRQKQPITWLYGYGNVEMLNGNVKKLICNPSSIAELPNRFVYTFDEKGNVVTLENIYQDGKNTTKYNTVYKNGKKIESIGFEIIDKVWRKREVYRYDNNGHITSFGSIMDIADASDSSHDSYRFWYDKTGLLVETGDYGWRHKFKYLYNEKGAVTGLERTHSDERGRFTYSTKDTIRYVLFDSNNNWLKEVAFGDTATRKITYY